MSDFVSDVYWEILVRLPAESLFRFRCVCKAWRRIIDDHSFIKAHTQIQLHNHTLLVADETEETHYTFSLDSLRLINGPQIVDATPIKRFVRKGALCLPDQVLVASCNGLLLLSNHPGRSRDVWEIWNPLTNECRKLPLPDFDTHLFSWEFGFGCGFGYDYDSDDYKVVRIDNVGSGGCIDLQTLVYSLKSDSWRKIEDYPRGLMLGEGCGAFLDGKIYWLSSMGFMDGVTEFDLKTERFCNFPLPPDSKAPETCDELVAMGGCLIYSINYLELAELEGWMMKDNGMEKTWIELFDVPYSYHYEEPELLRVVAYLKNKRQLLLHHVEDCGYMWCDIKNKISRDIYIGYINGGPVRKDTISKICPGSLVPLNSGGGAVASATTSRKRNTNRKDTRLKVMVSGEKVMVSGYDFNEDE